MKSLNHQPKVEYTVVINDLKNLCGWQPQKFIFTLLLFVHCGVAENVLPGLTTWRPRLTEQPLDTGGLMSDEKKLTANPELFLKPHLRSDIAIDISLTEARDKLLLH